MAGAIGPGAGVEDSVCGEGIKLGLDIRGQRCAADASGSAEHELFENDGDETVDVAVL